jgi:NADPH:quinone reductase-like Zn-dependent oxidoreductase
MQGVLVPKPANLSYAEAAVVPTAAMEAHHFMHKARIKAGDKVLIVGAGGSIGTFSTQIAHNLGAVVTAVDSGEKLELLRGMGADQVIDYTKEDYLSQSAGYDLIIDVVGRRGLSDRIKLLKPHGIYFLAFAGLSNILLAQWTSLTTSKKVKIEAASQSKEALLTLKEQIEAGQLKPILDRSFPLAQTAAAHRYAESGQKKGNIAITMGEAPAFRKPTEKN